MAPKKKPAKPVKTTVGPSYTEQVREIARKNTEELNQKKHSFWKKFRKKKPAKQKSSVENAEKAAIIEKKMAQKARSQQATTAELEKIQKNAVQASSLPFFVKAFGGKENA